MLYLARINHNKDSLIGLFVAEFRIYEKKTILFRLLLGAVTVISAVIMRVDIPIKGVMIALGAWFISSTDFPARLKADENIRKFSGKYPELTYSFQNSDFTLKEKNSMNINYSDIEHLAADKKYIYIFMGRSNAIVIDIKEIKVLIKGDSTNDVSDFKKFLESKSNKKFESSKSLIALNFFDLLDIFRGNKK